MEERIALMRAYDSGVYSVSELCTQFGISRGTFYAWRRRRDCGDERWFEELSARPAVQRGMDVGSDMRNDFSALSDEEKAQLRALLYNQRARPAPDA